MDDRKDSPKLMHDANALSDEKMLFLLKVDGWAGVGRFWNAAERIRSSRNCRLDTHAPGFWELIGEFWKLTEVESKDFISRLIWKFQLLATDSDEQGKLGRYLWCARIDRDVEKYRRSKSGNSYGGQVTAAVRHAPEHPSSPTSLPTPPLKPSDGEAVASFYLSVISSRSDRTDPVKFGETQKRYGIVDEQIARLRALGKEFGRECVAYYLNQVSLHLRGKGELKADFLSFAETWIRRDSVERRGWFKDHPFRTQERPRSEPVPRNLTPLVQSVIAGGKR